MEEAMEVDSPGDFSDDERNAPKESCTLLMIREELAFEAEEEIIDILTKGVQKVEVEYFKRFRGYQQWGSWSTDRRNELQEDLYRICKKCWENDKEKQRSKFKLFSSYLDVRLERRLFDNEYNVILWKMMVQKCEPQFYCGTHTNYPGGQFATFHPKRKVKQEFRRGPDTGRPTVKMLCTRFYNKPSEAHKRRFLGTKAKPDELARWHPLEVNAGRAKRILEQYIRNGCQMLMYVDRKDWNIFNSELKDAKALLDRGLDRFGSRSRWVDKSREEYEKISTRVKAIRDMREVIRDQIEQQRRDERRRERRAVDDGRRQAFSCLGWESCYEKRYESRGALRHFEIRSEKKIRSRSESIANEKCSTRFDRLKNERDHRKEEDEKNNVYRRTVSRRSRYCPYERQEKSRRYDSKSDLKDIKLFRRDDNRRQNYGFSCN